MKMERLVKRNTEIETCCNNIKLLTEMLNHYSPSSPSQDKELMKASSTWKFKLSLHVNGDLIHGNGSLGTSDNMVSF